MSNGTVRVITVTSKWGGTIPKSWAWHQLSRNVCSSKLKIVVWSFQQVLLPTTYFRSCLLHSLMRYLPSFLPLPITHMLFLECLFLHTLCPILHFRCLEHLITAIFDHTCGCGGCRLFIQELFSSNFLCSTSLFSQTSVPTSCKLGLNVHRKKLSERGNKSRENMISHYQY